MILTTSNSIDGRIVTEYKGLVYGADTYISGGLYGEGAIVPQNFIENVFMKAEELMAEKAERLGADAVIGINHSVTLSPGVGFTHILLVLSGTAVTTEISYEEKERIRQVEIRERELREQQQTELANNRRLLSEQLGGNEISPLEMNILKEIKDKGSISSISISKMFPRNATSDDMIHVLNRLESVDLIRRDNSGMYALGDRGREVSHLIRKG